MTKNFYIHISLIWITIIFVLITMFITIYDGKYQNLNRREFPDTTINGDLQVDDNLTVDGTTTQKGNLTVDGTTNLKGNVLGSIPTNGFKDISVITAADASHTLADTDAGVVVITAALATGSVIKLPAPTDANVGLYYKILIQGTMAGTASIGLPNSSSAVLVGSVNLAKVTANYTTAEANNVTINTGASTQLLDLDQDDEANGGAPGSVFEFYYVSTTKVVLIGHSLVNSITETTGTSMMNNTGWT